MNKATHNQLKDQFEEIQKELQDPNLDLHKRSELESLSAQITGALMSTWLPVGSFRKLLMIGFIVLGIYLIVQGQYIFGIISILVSLFFSPRLIGEIILLSK